MGYVPAFGQTLTESPYSNFGAGELNNLGFSRSSGMAGLGVATFERYTISSANPASIADLGVTTVDILGVYKSSYFTSDAGGANARSGGLQNLALGFPTHRNIAFGFGITPFSSVGLSVSEKKTFVDPDLVNPIKSFRYTSTTAADGGLSKAYLGAGMHVLKKFEVGLSLNYFFGTIKRNFNNADSLGTFSGTRQDNNILRGFAPAFGLNFSDTLGKIGFFRIGASVQLPASLSLNQRVVASSASTTSSTFIDTLSSTHLGTTTIPALFSFGVSMVTNKNFTLGADFSIQNWKGFKLSQSDSLTPPLTKSYIKVAVGSEWIPNAFKQNFFSRVAYRAGIRVEQMPYVQNNTSINNYAFTTGLGLPLVRQNTRFDYGIPRVNLGLEVGVRGTRQNGLIQETYFLVSLGINFNELWFVPIKYE